MGKYTVEDVKNTWASSGTEEYIRLVDACAELGLKIEFDEPHGGIDDVIECVDVGNGLKLYNPYSTMHVGKLSKPFVIKPDWSIYTNELPLCELSDEQYGKMRRAEAVGDLVEFFTTSSEWREVSRPNWDPARVYRIKRKSERDEFVGQCFNAAEQAPELTGMAFKVAYGKIFDAIKRGDIKAPEVAK